MSLPKIDTKLPNFDPYCHVLPDADHRSFRQQNKTWIVLLLILPKIVCIIRPDPSAGGIVLAKYQNNVVEYRVYDLPLDFSMILLHGDEWRISDVLSNRLHFHNCFEIGLCHTDGGIMVFEDRTLPFQAGDVTCIPRHIPHTTCSTKGTRSLWSYIFLDMEQLLGPAVLGENAADRSLPGSLDQHWVFSRSQHPRIYFLVTCIVEEVLDKKHDHPTVIRHMLMILYHELIRHQSAEREGEAGKSRYSFKLKPAFEHIAQNYMDPISVDELAAMCQLSTTHFRRLFASAVGESPVGFLNTTRINQACALLLTTNDSILSIAGAVGFATISSFNRYFSQVMGVSPREYRNPSIRDSLQPKRKYIIRHKGWDKPELRPEFVTEE